MRRVIVFYCYFVLALSVVVARRHLLKLKNDSRRAVICSHFGYYKGGYFSVSLEQLDGDIGHITFTLDKSGNAGVAAYLEAKPGNCFRGEPSNFLYFSFDELNSHIVIHNKDTQLHGLIFEAGARYLDDEEDNSDYPPANLADAIKLALESLYVPPVRSAEFALRLAKSNQYTSQFISIVSVVEMSAGVKIRRLLTLETDGCLRKRPTPVNFLYSQQFTYT
ncbi:unnamed protein product [Calicophoron daubneyi]|uniref:Uncharacterized protein n=1 Tax=Calicophoron daubneyi TaxID=300641 RepID=A0AAV2T3F9_CALDB